MSPSCPHEDEIARLRERIADLERQLHAARAFAGSAPALHAEIVRQQRQAEELARIARLVNETLDLTTVSERIAESVLGLLRVHSSAIRLLSPTARSRRSPSAAAPGNTRRTARAYRLVTVWWGGRPPKAARCGPRTS